MANCLYIVYHFYTIIIMAVESSSVYYISAPEMADRKCSPPDLMFSLTTKSDIVCAATCQPRTGCGSVFYNHVTGTCYGCYSYYHVNNTTLNLDVESNTTYYYPDVCGRGWTRHGDSCYTFKDVRLTWDDALADCRALNASLIEVNDAAEDDFLQALASDDRVWIGFNARTEEGTFGWVDIKNVVTYTNWTQGQPNNTNGNEDCAVQRNEGGWFAVPCTYEYSSMCEKSTYLYRTGLYIQEMRDRGPVYLPRLHFEGKKAEVIRMRENGGLFAVPCTLKYNYMCEKSAVCKELIPW